MNLLFILLCLYTIERYVFAVKIPAKRNNNQKKWLTLVPFLTYILIFFISVSEYSFMGKNLNYKISICGVLIFVLGILFRYWAVIVFKKHKQPWMDHVYLDKIDCLVKEGPYKLIRHPYYLSVILELCGVALFLNSFIGFICVFLVQAPLIWKRVVVEEEDLIKVFQEQYISYKNEVPAFCFFLRG